MMVLQCITPGPSLMEQSLIQAVIVEHPSSSSWDKVLTPRAYDFCGSCLVSLMEVSLVK
jgi:hypothetical protein